MVDQYLVTYEITVDADELDENTHEAAARTIADRLTRGLDMRPVLSVTHLVAGIQSGIPLSIDTEEDE